MITEETKEIWYSAIWDMFVKYGLRSTSVDDIASNLKVSKKTLYTVFTNKNDIVEQVVQWFTNPVRRQAEIDKINNVNPVEWLNLVKTGILKNINDCHIPLIFFDLKKYHTKVFESIDKEHYTFFKVLLSNIITKGIEQGYFKQDINKDAQIWLVSFVMHTIKEPEIHSEIKVPIKMVVSTIIDNLILSISTEKGLKEFDRINKNNK